MTSARTRWPSKPTTTTCGAEWLLGVHATRLDAAASAVQLDNGTTISADGIVVATGARARSWPGSEHLAGVHVLRTVDDAVALRDELRAGARLVVIGAGFIGAEVASTAAKLGTGCHGRRGRARTAGRPARRAARRRGGTAAHRARHPAAMRGCRSPGLTGSDRVTGVDLVDGRQLPLTSSLWASAPCPTSSGCAAAGLELGQRRVVRTRAGPPGARTWSRSATARPGMSRPSAGRTASSIGPARWNDRPSRSPLARRRADHGTAAKAARTSGPTSTAAASSSRASPIPATKSPSRWAAATMPASWPCTAAMVEPVAVLGVDQPKLFTRWRRQLATRPRRPA